MQLEEEMIYLWNLQMNKEIPNPHLIIFDGDNINIVAYSTKLGMICFSEPKINKDHMYIRMLFVNPEFRNRKIGSRFVSSTIKTAKQYNIKAVEVESENNSIGFFTKLGFVLIPNEINNRMRLNINY